MPACDQRVLRAAADLGDEHGLAIVDGADDRLEAVLVAITALAVQIDAAMSDEFRALGAEFVNLELLGVAEVFVDRARCPWWRLRSGCRCRSPRRRGFPARHSWPRPSPCAPARPCSDRPCARRCRSVTSISMIFSVVNSALRSSPSKSDRVGAALTAVPHHVHFAFAAVLQRLQLLRRRAALTVEAEHGAMLGRGDQRHDVVQEGAARLHRLVDLDQMLVVDARDHHRIDLAEDAALGQHFEALQLTLGQDPGRLDAGVRACSCRRSTDRFRADLRDRSC